MDKTVSVFNLRDLEKSASMRFHDKAKKHGLTRTQSEMRPKNNSEYVKRNNHSLDEKMMNQTVPADLGLFRAATLVMDGIKMQKMYKDRENVKQEEEVKQVQKPLQAQETIYSKKIMERRKKMKDDKKIRMS